MIRNSSVFKIEAERAAYTPLIEGNQLIAQIDRIGQGLWTLCCPLCSACHVWPANVQIRQGYTPPCDNMRTQHPTVYQVWASKHNPTGQRTVILRDRQPVIIPLTVPDEGEVAAA